MKHRKVELGILSDILRTLCLCGEISEILFTCALCVVGRGFKRLERLEHFERMELAQRLLL